MKNSFHTTVFCFRLVNQGKKISNNDNIWDKSKFLKLIMKNNFHTTVSCFRLVNQGKKVSNNKNIWQLYG